VSRFPKITATQTLPEILAVTGVRDYGPSDGEGSTACPHCGSRGRYVISFVCADGSRRGAMRGCVNLFPIARETSRAAKLIQEAFERAAIAAESKRKPARWWQDMIDATERFSAHPLPDVPAIQAARVELFRAVWEAESRRQEWLAKNGYGVRARRSR